MESNEAKKTEKVELDKVTQDVLKVIDSYGFKQEGAYNLRLNGMAVCHGDSRHINIVKKEDKPGIDIYISGEAKNEQVHIPVVMSQEGVDIVYNDFYIEQMTELLTNYGEIFMLWLDGACGAKADGQPVQKYDFERIWKTAVELQPNIVMSGCAPDVRWIGNESGKTRESEWNVVPQFQYDQQNFAANCQQDDDLKKFQKRCQDVMLPDMGSRKFLANYDKFMWYPAEVDVSIRLGWFYHPAQRLTLKSLKRLMTIYYNSVGNNSLMLLNIPPNRKGQFAKSDVRRLREMGKWLRREEECVLESSCVFSADGREAEITFPKQSVDRLRLAEDTTKSQRVEKFSVYAGEECVFRGTINGYSRIAIFDRPVVTDKLRFVIEECRNEPYMQKIEVCKTGAYRPF